MFEVLVGIVNINSRMEKKSNYEELILPCDNKKIDNAINKISINGDHKDCTITMYETPMGLELEESSNLYELNKKLQYLKDVVEEIKDEQVKNKLSYALQENGRYLDDLNELDNLICELEKEIKR